MCNTPNPFANLIENYGFRTGCICVEFGCSVVEIGKIEYMLNENHYTLKAGGWFCDDEICSIEDNKSLTHLLLLDFSKVFPELTFPALSKLAHFVKNDREYGEDIRTKNGSYVCKIICEHIYNNFDCPAKDLKTFLPIMTSAYNGCEEFESSIRLFEECVKTYGEINIASSNLYCSLFASSIDIYKNVDEEKGQEYAFYFCDKYLKSCNGAKIDKMFEKTLNRALRECNFEFEFELPEIFNKNGYAIEYHTNHIFPSSFKSNNSSK